MLTTNSHYHTNIRHQHNLRLHLDFIHLLAFPVIIHQSFGAFFALDRPSLLYLSLFIVSPPARYVQPFFINISFFPNHVLYFIIASRYFYFGYFCQRPFKFLPCNYLSVQNHLIRCCLPLTILFIDASPSIFCCFSLLSRCAPCSSSDFWLWVKKICFVLLYRFGLLQHRWPGADPILHRITSLSIDESASKSQVTLPQEP